MPRACGALLLAVLARCRKRSQVFIVDMSAPDCVDGAAIVLQNTTVAKAPRCDGRMAANGRTETIAASLLISSVGRSLRRQHRHDRTARASWLFGPFAYPPRSWCARPAGSWGPGRHRAVRESRYDQYARPARILRSSAGPTGNTCNRRPPCRCVRSRYPCSRC